MFTLAGLGHPCDEKDIDLFYPTTTIAIGDRLTAIFWPTPMIAWPQAKGHCSAYLCYLQVQKIYRQANPSSLLPYQQHCFTL
jgi:hypothetical protein